MVVTPGFVDTHTHYDAQLFYEPSASPASWHGVTSIVIGNCGFTLAPCRPGDTAFIRGLLSQVEEISHDAISAGVPFESGGIDDYLSGLDGALGVNAALLVGHSTVRRWVMGDAASERTATDDEIAAMAALVSM